MINVLEMIEDGSATGHGRGFELFEVRWDSV